VVGAPADSGTGSESAVGTGDCARGAEVDDIAPADRVTRGVDVGAPANEALEQTTSTQTSLGVKQLGARYCLHDDSVVSLHICKPVIEGHIWQ